MLEGFLLGLAFWLAPALLAWLIMGPARVRRHLHH
jgi:hypothetical protein